MRKRRWSKWDIAGVSVALLLLAILLFRAYISGALFPRYYLTHNDGYHRMPRVWISGPIKDRYSFRYSDWNDDHAKERQNKLFKFMPPHSPCGISGTFEHDWWHFYYYSPPGDTDFCN